MNLDARTHVASTDPRYPIGRFRKPAPVEPPAMEHALLTLGELPSELRNAVDGLDPAQLATPYREGGWTVLQTVHHVADSHMNAYIRMKLALTEDAPTIKTYEEPAWATLHDAKDAPAEWSLDLIEALHARWAMLLRSLTPAQWQRTFVHPEHGAMTLQTTALLYAWHGLHHTAHITHLRNRMGW